MNCSRHSLHSLQTPPTFLVFPTCSLMAETHSVGNGARCFSLCESCSVNPFSLFFPHFSPGCQALLWRSGCRQRRDRGMCKTWVWALGCYMSPSLCGETSSWLPLQHVLYPPMKVPPFSLPTLPYTLCLGRLGTHSAVLWKKSGRGHFLACLFHWLHPPWSVRTHYSCSTPFPCSGLRVRFLCL